MQKYNVSNFINEYAEQLYPFYIYNVEYIDVISKKYPNGMAQITCATVDGYYASGLMKCYIDKKNVKYIKWGGHRLNVGTKNEPINLIGVPYNMIQTLTDCSKSYGTLVE